MATLSKACFHDEVTAFARVESILFADGRSCRTLLHRFGGGDRKTSDVQGLIRGVESAIA